MFLLIHNKRSVGSPFSNATQEDVEVISTAYSKTQLSVQQSRSGDPEVNTNVCLSTYASDADSAYDDDNHLLICMVFIEWELTCLRLGWVNVIYRKDNSRKCFSKLREILHLVTRTDLMIIYGLVMTFYQDKEATGVGLVLWGDLKVLIDSPEVIDGSDVWEDTKHLDYSKLEAIFFYWYSCVGDVGNKLTTAVQLIAFLKKQLSGSRRPKAIRLELIEVWFQFPGYPKLDGFSTCHVLVMKTVASPRVEYKLVSCCVQRSGSVFWRFGFKDVVVQSSGAYSSDKLFELLVGLHEASPNLLIVDQEGEIRYFNAKKQTGTSLFWNIVLRSTKGVSTHVISATDTGGSTLITPSFPVEILFLEFPF
ncbi:hypothetical protein Tco_1428241 [Tanacetum coccineum]